MKTFFILMLLIILPMVNCSKEPKSNSQKLKKRSRLDCESLKCKSVSNCTLNRRQIMVCKCYLRHSSENHLEENKLEQCVMNHKYDQKSAAKTVRHIGKNNISRKKTETKHKDDKNTANKKKQTKNKADKKEKLPDKKEKLPKPYKEPTIPSILRTKLPKSERLTRRSTEKINTN